LVGLSTAATVIASQALISGAFSITKQAVSLGYLPRVTIQHTSKEEIGQIYVPFVNWGLLISTIGLVVFFGSSSNLAAAYGLAVTTTMVITTILTFFVTQKRWKWRLSTSLLVCVPFLIIDLCYFSASVVKIPHGGWFPLLVGILILTCMSTWRRGRTLLAERLRALAMTIPDFIAMVRQFPLTRVPGTAIFMTSTLEYVPSALLHNVRHNHVLHENVILMTVSTAEVPHVPREERYTLERLSDGLYTLSVVYGFMDVPNAPAVLMRCESEIIKLDLEHLTFFLGRETVLATNRPGMALWRESLFSFMSRNAQRATAYFRIPSQQVVELGIQVEI
jgi:KUP system potassium uptake protein